MGALAGAVYGLLNVLFRDDHVVRSAVIFAAFMGIVFSYQRVREYREHRLQS